MSLLFFNSTPSSVGLGNVTNTPQLPLSYLDTDGTAAANSNTKVLSEAAVVTYVGSHAGGGSTPTISDTDPGAVGAGHMWLRLATGNSSRGYVDNYGAAMYVRDSTNSFWIPTAPVVYDVDNKMRGFMTIGQDGQICLETFDYTEASQMTMFLGSGFNLYDASGNHFGFAGGQVFVGSGCVFNVDGSGQLAGMNISWDASGHLTTDSFKTESGYYQQNNDGSGKASNNNFNWDSSGNVTALGFNLASGNSSLNPDGSTSFAGGSVTIGSDGALNLPNGAIAADGSGHAAGNTINWDNLGNLTAPSFNIPSAISLNSDGSGYLASNYIHWDTGGNFYASSLNINAGETFIDSSGNVIGTSFSGPSSAAAELPKGWGINSQSHADSLGNLYAGAYYNIGGGVAPFPQGININGVGALDAYGGGSFAYNAFYWDSSGNVHANQFYGGGSNLTGITQSQVNIGSSISGYTGMVSSVTSITTVEGIITAMS